MGYEDVFLLNHSIRSLRFANFTKTEYGKCKITAFDRSSMSIKSGYFYFVEKKGRK